MARYLDPKVDVTFKKVFGEHKNLPSAAECRAKIKSLYAEIGEIIKEM